MVAFSIVVPTYERPESLAQLLDSLARLEYPSAQFEVIVVDDGSRVSLQGVISDFEGRLNVSLVHQSNAGPAAARNRGAQEATGRFLAFTDDDCRPERLWLLALSDALGGSEHVVCGGRAANGLPGNICSEATQLLADYLLKCYSPAHIYGGFFPANNLALSRSAFWGAGGFDPSLRFGEDRDFCCRCASLGYSFVLAQDALVRHAHPLTLGSFLRLHYCYGGGTFHFRRGCAAKGLPRVRISPPSWYVGLVLEGVRKHKNFRGAGLTLLLMASQAAAASAMLRGSPKKEDRPSHPNKGRIYGTFGR
jgi:glycosyltransferase involved in cell wall biosynthesis